MYACEYNRVLETGQLSESVTRTIYNINYLYIYIYIIAYVT